MSATLTIYHGDGNGHGYRLMRKAAGRMYSLGLIASSSVMMQNNTTSVAIRLDLHRRPYVLGWPTHKWRCLLRFHHWPDAHVVAFGYCGKCLPWPCCGATGADHSAACVDADQ